MSIDNSSHIPDLDFDTPAQQRLRRIRKAKDRFARGGIAVGGISVIVAILLIFFYLLYEVAPLFQSAKIERWQDNGQQVQSYAVPGSGKTLYMTMEEQAEIGLRVNDEGELFFLNTRTGVTVIQSSNAINGTDHKTRSAKISIASTPLRC